MITFNNCTLYAEESKETKLLGKLNLTIKKASKTVITGPSGSGKTTLLKNIAGLKNSISGDLKFNDTLVKNKKDLIQCSIFLGQESINYQDTVENLFYFVKSFSNNHDLSSFTRENFMKYLQKLALDKTILQKNFSALSGGEKKRVEFAFCLLGDKEILLLDELLAPLHPHLKDQVTNYLLSLDKTIILISHEMEKLKAFEELNLSSFVGGDNER